MNIYTVQIEATDDGQIWYALGDPESDERENARRAAEDTVQNQNLIDDDYDGDWRILVWEGTDTGAEPTYVHYLTRHEGTDTSA